MVKTSEAFRDQVCGFISVRGMAAGLLAMMILLPTGRSAAQEEFNLSADAERRWYRGNLHTHSLWSDGDDYPERIAAWYRDRGYQFLVFSDHNVLLQGERWIDVEKNKGGLAAFQKLKADFPGDWITTRINEGRQQVRLKTFDEIFARLAVPQKYLLIQGEEVTDRFRNLPVHMCVTNTRELFPPMGGNSVLEVMQQNVNAVIARRERTGQKSMIHLNHPNFGYAVTAEQLMHVVGERFFEVYNGHPTVHNSGDASHASTERMWDIINTSRLSRLDLPLMLGLATDDGHDYHRGESLQGSQPGRGWVMVLAQDLNPDAIVDGLEKAEFYASSGVTLKRIARTSTELTVDVAAEEGQSFRIDFIGTMRNFDAKSAPAADDAEKAEGLTRIYSNDVGAVLKTVNGLSGTYRFTGNELYVRALVTSSKKHPNPSEPGEFERAWVQPVAVSAR